MEEGLETGLLGCLDRASDELVVPLVFLQLLDFLESDFLRLLDFLGLDFLRWLVFLDTDLLRRVVCSVLVLRAIDFLRLRLLEDLCRRLLLKYFEMKNQASITMANTPHVMHTMSNGSISTNWCFLLIGGQNIAYGFF